MPTPVPTSGSAPPTGPVTDPVVDPVGDPATGSPTGSATVSATGSATGSATTSATEPGGPGARVAAAVVVVQAVVLAGFAVFYVIELVLRQGDDAMRVLMSAVLIAFFAFLLYVVARRLWSGEGWAQTATGVWQVLLIPVGISLVQSAQLLLGILVLLMAVLGLGGLVVEQVRLAGRE